MGAGPVRHGRRGMIHGTKKAAPVLEHQDGKVETEPASQAGPHLHQQSTTSPPPGQRVSDHLLPGQQNAVPLKRLKELLDLDGRTIRLMIRSERLHGTPILADCVNGYYLPGNDYERVRCVRSMRKRAAEIVRAADAIEEAGKT